MNQFTPLIERIRHDVQCGGKMGQPSALRLLDVIEQMGQEIARLERRIEHSKEPRP